MVRQGRALRLRLLWTKKTTYHHEWIPPMLRLELCLYRFLARARIHQHHRDHRRLPMILLRIYLFMRALILMPSKLLCKRSSKRFLMHLRPRHHRPHLRNLSLNFRRHRLRLRQAIRNRRRLSRLEGLTHILISVPLIMDMGLLSHLVKIYHQQAWALDTAILLAIVRRLQDLPIHTPDHTLLLRGWRRTIFHRTLMRARSRGPQWP